MAVELQRCQEILAWLNDEHRENVRSQPWAVLDDLNLSRVQDAIVIKKMQGHVVQTNPEAGLTEKNVQEVARILLGDDADVNCSET